MYQRKKNSHDPCGFTLTFQLEPVFSTLSQLPGTYTVFSSPISSVVSTLSSYFRRLKQVHAYCTTKDGYKGGGTGYLRPPPPEILRQKMSQFDKSYIHTLFQVI